MGSYNRKKTNQKRAQKSDLGASWAPFGTGFGRVLQAPGASWAVLRALFFMLVFGVVSKSALEGIWDGFWLDFEGFGKGFGRILGGFWEGFGWILRGFLNFWARFCIDFLELSARVRE